MKKYMWSFSIWMAVTTAIYSLIYLLSPLGGYGLMWMTFVALPIFFTAGAKPKEIPNYLCSMAAGLVWGVINLEFIGLLTGLGLSGALANAADLLILTIVSVGLHLAHLDRTWFNKVPMIFGGLAMTFSQGGKNLPVIAITLACGILLAAVYGIGGKWLENKLLPKEQTT